MGGTVHQKKRREPFLSIFGPLSLLVLLTLWATTLVLGFACIHWAIGSWIGALRGPKSFLTDLYFSGTTFFTLGLGDVTPAGAAARAGTVLEASCGLGRLAPDD